MIDFQQKRKVRSVMYHKVTLVILGILVLLSLRSVWLIYQKQRESEELLKTSQQHVADLTARENEVHNEINQLQTPEGVEAEIRSKFSVAKIGENVVLIVDSTASSSQGKSPGKSWWQKIVDFF